MSFVIKTAFALFWNAFLKWKPHLLYFLKALPTMNCQIVWRLPRHLASKCWLLSVEVWARSFTSVKCWASSELYCLGLFAGGAPSDVTTPCPEADLVADKDNKANYISASLYSGLLATNPDWMLATNPNNCSQNQSQEYTLTLFSWKSTLVVRPGPDEE